jgi:low temperature requirement protein LtrA
VRIPSSPRASRAELWARLCRSLWQPPRPHGEQPRERVVGPLELFYDLAVVVLVAQAAHHLAEHLTWPGLGEFAAVFTLVWIAWANGSLHHELHGHDDARARSTFLLQILLLVAMAAFIPEAGGAWWTYFDFAGQRRPRPEPVPTVQWILGHLPLTAAVAVMGAAMVSLVDHAHDGRTPAATAWVLSAGAAVVLGTTMLVAATLPAWEDKRGLYRPLARTSVAVALACLGVGAVRPTPIVLGLALVLLLSIPWGFAVVRRLAGEADRD